MVPTRLLWILLGVAAIPFAVAPAVPSLFWIGVGADLLLVAVLVYDFAITLRPSSFEVSLRSERVASLGSPFTATLTLTTTGNLGGACLARLPWPETWKPERATQPFQLDDRGSADIPFTATPRRRGRTSLTRAWIRYPSTLGLFHRDAAFDVPAEIKVYPAMASLKAYDLLVRRLRLREMGLRSQRIRGQGMEFARMREYQHGDDPRLIDWKATARRERLITREYQVERCQNIMLMIDAGRMLTEEVDGLTKIEYVLHAALLLARVAAQHDDRIGALVFSDRIERYIEPRKGSAALPALAEALFDIEPRLCESDYDAAFRHVQATNRKRALVVLFTNVMDQETSGLVTGYMTAAAARHVPLFVAVDDRETRALADRSPETEEEAYLKAGACRLIGQRAKTLQDMQRRGVHVIDAPAGKIPIAVANRYLDLKARQVL